MPPATRLANFARILSLTGQSMPAPRRSSHIPRQQHAPGAVLLGLATLDMAATVSLVLPTANAIYCDRLAPLAVLAALSATLIALCFRSLATASRRRLPGVALALAAAGLFASTRFIVHYHAACAGVMRQLHQQGMGR